MISGGESQGLAVIQRLAGHRGSQPVALYAGGRRRVLPARKWLYANPANLPPRSDLEWARRLRAGQANAGNASGARSFLRDPISGQQVPNGGSGGGGIYPPPSGACMPSIAPANDKQFAVGGNNLAYDAASDKLVLIDGTTAVKIVNPANGNVDFTITVGRQPSFIFYENTLKRIYVCWREANASAIHVTIFDGISYTQLHQIDFPNPNANGTTISEIFSGAFDDVHGRVWLSDDNQLVYGIDIGTYAVISVDYVFNPQTAPPPVTPGSIDPTSGVAYCRAQNVIAVGCFYLNSNDSKTHDAVSTLSPTTGAYLNLIDVSDNGGGQRLVYDPDNSLLYMSQVSGATQNGGIQEIDPGGGVLNSTWLATPDGAVAGLVYNPCTKRILMVGGAMHYFNPVSHAFTASVSPGGGIDPWYDASRARVWVENSTQISRYT